ncbi:MAG TPA: ParA family protein [Candidatus Nanopelagicaceae bacterium]
MANSSSKVSRLDDKSTNRDEELATTSSVLGRKFIDFSNIVPAPVPGAARVISIVNQKGGVGKTTTTINLGAALAELGRRVLLIDFDSQASMTTGLGIKPVQLKEQYGSMWYLLNDPQSNIQEFILKSNIPGLDFIRGHEDLAAAEAAFVTEIAKEHKLRKILVPVIDQYDDILIDCSPSLGTLTINALTASNGVLIPMECEYFAVLGLSLVKKTIEKIRENTNPKLVIDGILATMFDRKTGHSRDVLELIDKEFPSELLDTIISRTVRFSESTVRGEPITSFASSSLGAISYRRLARELISRGGAK